MISSSAHRNTGLGTLGLTGAALAALLPAYLLAFGAPLSAADPNTFAQIHTAPGFQWRAFLTLVYFPGAVLAHYAFVLRLAPRVRPLALLGFAMFVLGNGIDGCYRAVQFMVVHNGWAAQWLETSDPLVRQLLWQRIETFTALAPAIQLSFAVCFAAGRWLMGSAGLGSPRRMISLAASLMVASGILNLLPWVAQATGQTWLRLPSPVYLGIWLLGLLAIGSALAQPWQPETPAS